MKNNPKKINHLIRKLASFALLVTFGLSASAQEMTNVVPDGFSVVNFSDIVEFDKKVIRDPSKKKIGNAPWEDIYKFDLKKKLPFPENDVKPGESIMEDPFGKMAPVDAEPMGKGLRMASPAPLNTFNGCGDNDASIPPDVNGAVGPGHIMVTLNTQIKITDRSGNQISIVDLDSWWNTVLPLQTTGTFDPKVLYEPFNRRWIVVSVADARNSNSSLLIAVSRNSDPTGLWYHYRFDYDANNNNWFDYPCLGYNNKWIAVSGNIFTNTTPSSYVRSEIFVFNKANLYAGVAVPALTRMTSVQGFTIQPAVTHDNSTATPLYLVNDWNGNSNNTGYIRLHKLDGNVGTPAYSSITLVSTPNTWGFEGNNNGEFAPQLGSTALIDVGDSRMQKVVFRNNSIWCTQNVYLPASSPNRSAIQWWQFTPTGTVTQIGRIDNTSGIFYAYPSIDVNASNDAVIGYSRFSSTTYASAAYSIRYGTDAVNTLQSPYVYKAGLAPYNKTYSVRNRWGDYSSVCLDPNKPNNFFVLQEYAELPSGGLDKWGTWWANVAGNNPKTPNYVVTDVTANKAFYYDSNFNLITSNTLSSTTIGGTTNVSDVCTKPGGIGGPSDLILDATNKRILRSTLTGTAAVASKTLRTNAGANLTSPTGIDVLGDSLYVLDKGGKAIYRYSLASAFSGSGTINAAQKITLTAANSKAESMRVLGAGFANLLPSIYVLDDNSPKRIYNYTLAGAYSTRSNSLTGNPALSNVTGLSSYSVLNPITFSFDYFYGVVDRGTDRYYEFKGNQVFSSVVAPATATIVRQLNSANLNCTGIDFSTNPGILREGEQETIEVADEMHLTAFPNPTSGLISLMMRGIEPVETRIMVYDLMGRQISEKALSPGELPANELQIDLSQMPPGNYLIAVLNGESSKTVIVQRH